MSALYVYAVLAEAPRADWGTGIEGARVEAIAHVGLAALVHDVPSGRPYQGPEQDVRAWIASHHSVVDRAWTETRAVLPMTFDVLVSGDATLGAADRLRSWLASERGRLHAALERVRDRGEVKAEILVQRSDATLDSATDEALDAAREELATASPGARVLLRRRILDLERSRAERLADALYPSVRRTLALRSYELVERRRARADASSAMVISASLLIDDGRLDELGTALAQLRDAHPYLTIRFLGPWAPYSFASLEAPTDTR